MEKFIKASIYFLIVGGIILLILPVRWFPSFYDVRYMGGMALASSLIIYFVPGLFFRAKKGVKQQKNRAALWLQFFLAFAFIGNALGDLGLYKLYQYGFEFDKVLHFFTPFLGAITLAYGINELWKIRPSRAAFLSFLTIIAFGVAWEFFEYLADSVLKTHISGVYGLNVSVDTKFDFLFDIFGSLAGAISSVYFWKYISGLANVEQIKKKRSVAFVLIMVLAIGFCASILKM